MNQRETTIREQENEKKKAQTNYSKSHIDTYPLRMFVVSRTKNLNYAHFT